MREKGTLKLEFEEISRAVGGKGREESRSDERAVLIAERVRSKGPPEMK